MFILIIMFFFLLISMELQSKAQSSQVMHFEDDKRNMTGRISSLEEEKRSLLEEKY